MKKVIALLLVLILSFGVLVSCNGYDLRLHQNNESTTGYDGSFPVIPTILKSTYTCYNVTQKKDHWEHSDKEDFQKWIFDDNESFTSFWKENISSRSCEEITESTFSEHFLVVVYRKNDVRHTDNYSYGDFQWKEYNKYDEKTDGFYSLVFEYTSYEGRQIDSSYKPPSFDIVLVPREDGPQDLGELSDNFCISMNIHQYSLDIKVVK